MSLVYQFEVKATDLEHYPFGEYLRSHIFTPLQMSQTFHATTMTEAQQRASHMATGHLMAFAIPFAAQELSGYLGSNAGIISTADDMAKYLILHSNGGTV
jgi:CubicO group peptidase (beta-lactamase class C family)